jgi:N-acetyl-1-D-myo-inositol-2-amino-2-deoxy-alpha-D-glucopyranoside deacetylase
VPRTLLAVHAHPDDESITMGGTLARAVRRGDRVVLLTCTLGEQGEVIGPELQGLVADQADQLGGFRWWELAAACAALGVTERRMLGGVGAFRDSGMAGTPSAAHPRAFVRARAGGPDHDRAVELLAAVIDEVRPDALLTYDSDGGYGHPDHLAAHEVSMAAAGPVPVLAVVRPAAESAAAVAALPVPDGHRAAGPGDLGGTVPDDRVDLRVDVDDLLDVRRAALGAHRTQIELLAEGFALSNRIAQPLLRTENFRVLAGSVPPDLLP